MANMNKKKGGGIGSCSSKTDGGWRKEDDEIQAIVVADSFDRKFTPINHETPRALLPLGNKLTIDYTIEYLLEQGVQEIIVFCCSFGERIREYILTKWANMNNKCNIHCVMSSTSDCLCFGDALREIDREGLIRSDFILVNGDIISNVKLGLIIKEHKEKRKKEKNLAMTMIHKKANPGHFSRSHDEETVVALEGYTNRLLYYQKMHGCRKFMFPTNLLSIRKEINIHYDLADSHIYICSPQVAPLFTDNFDYQILDDFIRGILTNEEILGDQIRSSIILDGYSCRVNDLHLYNTISLDLMNRWIYPLVPDNPSYTYKRNNVYLEKNVTLLRECHLTDGVIVGKGSSIGEKTKISQSVLGSNCKIGSNVEIRNSFLWDNCVIEDGVSIIQSLVCSNVVVKKSANLIDSLISYNVCIGSGMNLAPLTRLSLLKKEDLEEEMGEMVINDHDKGDNYDFSIVGEDGMGFVWPLDTEEEDFIPSLTGNNYESSSDESSDEEDDQSLPPPPVEYSNVQHFHMEVIENLRSGILENIAADNIALEINASKFKFNISISELCQTIIKAILELSIKDETRGKQEIAKDLDKVIKSLHLLLVKYFSNIEEQAHAITAAEEFFSSRVDIGGVFVTFLHKMYDMDIIDENVILKWYKTPPQCEDIFIESNYLQLRENTMLTKFITWLQEAEEEDSEEDSD